MDIFQEHMMAPTPIDQFQQTGKAILADKFDAFVNQGKVISFVMLGFPFKSTNTRDKVIGKLPDLGEQATLENFARFNLQIKEVYSPGVRIGIASDGYIFNDLLNEGDSVVQQYNELSRDLGNTALAPMDWYTLGDFFHGSLSEQRHKVMEQFAPTPEQLQHDILMNPDVNFLYRSMLHFMEEELADKGYPSRSQTAKHAKLLTREMMLRNEAWSNVVNKEFSDRIRISMHPSVNSGSKYSFRLIPGERVHHSPWHCAIYLDGKEYVTIHKIDAEHQGLRLVYKDGRPYYYVNDQNLE